MGKGQIDALILPAFVIIFVFVVAGVSYVLPTFYDISEIEGSDNTTGSIEIDQDNLEDIAENTEEFADTLNERFSWNVLINLGLIFLLFLIGISFAGTILINIIRR